MRSPPTLPPPQNLKRAPGPRRGLLRGPDDQTHSFQSETSYPMMPNLVTLVFILKTRSDQILAKLINQGVAAALLSSKHSKNLKMKNFPLLENCWNWHGGSILGWEERFWTQKTHSFKVKTRFPGLNSRNWWLVLFFRGKFCDVISTKLEELPTSNFASGMLLCV